MRAIRLLACNWKDLSHPDAGGAEVYLHEVLKQLAGWGHEVTLFSSNVNGRPVQECVDGVRVVRGGGRYTVYRQAERFYSTRPASFDVVLDVVNTRPFMTPNWRPEIPCIALIYQVAREVWHHEFPAPLAWLGASVLERRWLAAYRDRRVLTISNSSRESLHDYGLRRVTVVPVGLSQQDVPVPARKSEDLTFAFVGRLARNKRPEHAIEAFQLARSSLPRGARLVVLGTGPLESDLRRRYTTDAVDFLGRVDEATKASIVSSAHALLVTSVREGWGMVVSEAAALGTPALGYDVPGLRDSIAAAGGVLVAPGPEALATAMTAYADHLLRESLPIDIGSVVSWEHVAEAVLREVKDVLRWQDSFRGETPSRAD